MNSKVKDSELLGVNVSTASNRLVKDLLFSLIVETNKDTCFRCGFPLIRENFSIEHTVAWRLAENPKEVFFDLKRIAYSHLNCNSAHKDHERLPCGTVASYVRGCRCLICKKANANRVKSKYSTEKRQLKYKRTGN